MDRVTRYFPRLLALLTLCTTSLVAQETGTIVGTVKDATTAESLSGAQVFVNSGRASAGYGGRGWAAVF